MCADPVFRWCIAASFVSGICACGMSCIRSQFGPSMRRTRYLLIKSGAIDLCIFTNQTREIRRACFENQRLLPPKAGFGFWAPEKLDQLRTPTPLKCQRDTEGFNPCFHFHGLSRVVLTGFGTGFVMGLAKHGVSLNLGVRDSIPGFRLVKQVCLPERLDPAFSSYVDSKHLAILWEF